MSQVTTWMTEYAEGRLARETLVERLVAFDYGAPGRFDDIPDNIWEADAQAEERTYDEEGTFDEVLMGHANGLVDIDLVIEVVEGIEKVQAAED